MVDSKADSDGVWKREPRARSQAVESLVEIYPDLPADYVEFLRAGDGAEGSLGVEPGWIQLWDAKAVTTLNVSYSVSEFLSDFVGIGTNGGGELIAFDRRSWRVFMIPLIPMDPKEAVEIAPDFVSLAREFGHSAPAV